MPAWTWTVQLVLHVIKKQSRQEEDCQEGMGLKKEERTIIMFK